MAAETVPYGRATQHPPAVAEVHILWITAGLGCDGDSVSITAATQPSIEDVLLGAIPGLPKVHLHNPVLAYENGDDFLKYWYLAEEGKLEPFVLVVEGLHSEREDQERRLLGGAGHRSNDQTAHHHQRMDRPPGAQGFGGGCLRNLRHLWRHSRHGRQSDRLHGSRRLSWVAMASKAGLPIVNVPGCPVQPDNFMETLFTCSIRSPGVRP